jgi:hypothetical protein
LRKRTIHLYEINTIFDEIINFRFKNMFRWKWNKFSGIF